MRPSHALALAAGAGLARTTEAQSASQLVGTWTTKSNATFTGSAFYNPSTDRLIEPSHPGISYSFTEDGWYEVAYYRAIANPTNPECPSGILQWQHGTYDILSNGSLTLVPIGADGRQLQSAPCKSRKSVYSRYNQSEVFESFAQYTDPYHGIPRLDLYQFNGAPLTPMYLAYKPPQMNPTQTLHAGKATGTARARVRRSLEILEERVPWVEKSKVWWFGVGMTGVGSVLYFCF